jgi:hypothetical protein
MPAIGSPIYKVARALYELMPERWAGGLEPSTVDWHSASDETKARLYEAAKVAIWTMRPVGDRMRMAGEAVSPDAVMSWTAMIDAALDLGSDVPVP